MIGNLTVRKGVSYPAQPIAMPKLRICLKTAPNIQIFPFRRQLNLFHQTFGDFKVGHQFIFIARLIFAIWVKLYSLQKMSSVLCPSNKE